jgi:hypothetical protein
VPRQLPPVVRDFTGRAEHVAALLPADGGGGVRSVRSGCSGSNVRSWDDRIRCRLTVPAAARSAVVAQLVVEPLRLVELVFEGHDATG